MNNLRRNKLLIAIICVAALIRLININGHTLWYDEAFAVLFAEKGVSAMLYGTLAPVSGGAADIHPLLYYTTLNIWMNLLGQSPIVLRLWSILLGLGTIMLVYLIATDLFGKRVGLASALIIAIAPFHVQYSQEVRMYSLLTFLLMGVTWCFLQARKPDSKHHWRLWVVFGILSGLAMHTQQLAAFYLVAIGLIPFISRRRQDIIGVFIGAGIAFVVYLPWLVNIPGQLEKVNSYYWILPPDGIKLLLTIRSFLSVQLDIPQPDAMIVLMGSLFLLLFCAIQIVMYLRKPLFRRKALSQTSSTDFGLYFVLWLFCVPVILMWLVSQVQPVYLERALLPSALMLYIALGWFLTQSGLPKPIAGLLVLIGLMLSAIGLYHQYTWATFPNSPFQDAVNLIDDTKNENDVVIHMNKLSALPMVYYQRELPQRYIQDVPGSSEDTLALPTQEVLNIYGAKCIAQAVADSNVVWFVVFERVAREYERVGRTDLIDVFSWLDSHFTQVHQYTFNDLLIYHYIDGSTDRNSTCEDTY